MGMAHSVFAFVTAKDLAQLTPINSQRIRLRNEPGLIHGIVRVAGTEPVRLRERGP